MERKRVGIVLFEDVEVLDFCGPFEVFSATRMNEEKRREEPSPFEVLLIAENPSPITTTGGMKVLPHYTFDSCPRVDILVCPGGWGTRKELKNPIMLEWLRARDRGGNPGGSLHWLDAARLRRTSRRAARDYSLAFPRLDARILSHRHRRVRQTFRPRWQSVDFCRDLSGHRHVAQSRGELLRRGNSQGHRSAHGIFLSGKRCAPNPDLSLTRPHRNVTLRNGWIDSVSSVVE